MLVDLQPAGQRQGELDLFSAVAGAPGEQLQRDRSALMATMDELNRRFGRSSVHIGSASTTAHDTEERSWATRQERRSPRFTTRWDEIPIVRA
jgi:DNA polymerase V